VTPEQEHHRLNAGRPPGCTRTWSCSQILKRSIRLQQGYEGIPSPPAPYGTQYHAHGGRRCQLCHPPPGPHLPDWSAETASAERGRVEGYGASQSRVTPPSSCLVPVALTAVRNPQLTGAMWQYRLITRTFISFEVVP